MTTQTENAIARYRRNLEKALQAAPREVRSEAIQDAGEFLIDEVHAMDVGRLTSEGAAYDRFVERFGTPEQLAASYLEQCDMSSPVKANCVRRKRIAADLLLAIAVTGGVCHAVLREPPKVSPFTDVRFRGDQVFVTYDGHKYEWLELDHLLVRDIVASSKKQFGSRWQKRVAEDLVEVLWGMGHRPSGTVRLRLLDPATNKENVVSAATMTENKRWSVYQKRLDADEPPKVSPFTDVRFRGDQVFVTYDGHKYEWLELDHLLVRDIVASSKKQFGSRWQKRVAEDLVEVLWGMGHRPSGTVRLRLLDPATNKENVVSAATMTENKRWSVYQKRLDADVPPKVSPSTDVRFQDDRVFVTDDGHKYEWLELDHLTFAPECCDLPPRGFLRISRSGSMATMYRRGNDFPHS